MSVTKKYRPLLVAFAVLVVAGVGAYEYWAHEIRGIVKTEDARLAATMIDIGAELPGKLVEVSVSEGSKVKAGDLLFRVDTRDIEAEIEAVRARIPAAEARVRAAQARHEKALNGARPEEIHLARTSVDRSRVAQESAERDLDRAKHLLAEGASTQERVDTAQTAADLAQRNFDAANEQLRLLRHGTRSEDLDAAEAELLAAQAELEASKAALASASLALEHAVIRAPFDGVVVRTWRDQAETVGAGTTVVTLLDPKSLHVNANIEEADLQDVHIGAPVTVEVDAYPDTVLHGHVTTITDATTSQFSLIPSDSASGAFIKVAQRVPIEVTLDEVPTAPDKRWAPGLSVVLAIHYGDAEGAKL